MKSEEEWSGEAESGGEEESGEDSDGEDDEAVPVKSAYELLAEANKAKNARHLASLGLGKGESPKKRKPKKPKTAAAPAAAAAPVRISGRRKTPCDYSALATKYDYMDDQEE